MGASERDEGEIADWHDLAHRKARDIEDQGIHLLLAHSARGIDSTEKTFTVVGEAGQCRRIPYDILIINIGAVPARPSIEGLKHRACSSCAR